MELVSTPCDVWTGLLKRGEPITQSGESVQRLTWEWDHGEPIGNRRVVPVCGTTSCVRRDHMRVLSPDNRVAALRDKRIGAFRVTVNRRTHYTTSNEADAYKLAEELRFRR